MGKTKKKRDRASKQFMIAIWIVLGLLVVVICFSVRNTKKHRLVQSAGNVSTVQAPRERSSGYKGESSPQFNQALIQKGKQDAQQARAKGKSFVAPMTNGEEQKPVNSVLQKAKRFKKKQAEAPKLEAKPLKTIPKPPKTSPKRNVHSSETVHVDQKATADIRSALKGQLAMISKKMVYKEHTAMVYKPLEKPQSDDQTNQAATVASSEPAKQTSFNMVRDLKIRPGDVFYSANMQTINTDTPAPVATIEILSGPMKHSITEGTFELVGDSIRFTLYKLTTKNGDIYEMKGFAVDPTTHFAGVASEVDRHLIQRWGGLAAASFLSGWGTAVANSGSASSTNMAGGIITSENPVYSLKDKFWIASGEIANNLSDAAKANFNRSVTAWLKSNDPVGVLIIDLKPIK